MHVQLIEPSFWIRLHIHRAELVETTETICPFTSAPSSVCRDGEINALDGFKQALRPAPEPGVESRLVMYVQLLRPEAKYSESNQMEPDCTNTIGLNRV
jgi:hypothetical protein